jgi:hypothetical protein
MISSHALSKLSRCAVVWIAVAVLPWCAHAQGFGLTPGTVEMKFVPGQPVSFDLEFTNAGSAPIEMHTTVSDWGYDEKGGKIFPPSGTLPRSAATWVEVVPQTFTVPGNQSGKMRVMITPPAKAEGGYYCVIFAESKPVLSREATKKEEAIYANFRMGSLVMLTAEHTERYKIEVGTPKLKPPTATQPLSVEVPLENQSNTHIFARAEMAVLDANRKPVARIASNPVRLLPQQKDTLSLTWSGEISPGNYTGLLTVVYADNKLSTQEVPFTVEASK